MVGQVKDARGENVCTRDARRVGAERHGRPSRTRLADLLGEVLAIAAREGQTRAMVADQVGRSPRSIASYVEYGAGGVDCPGPVLLEMIQNPAVLGERARDTLVDGLLRPAGLAAHGLPAPDASVSVSLEHGALDVNAAVGRMTQDVIDATRDRRVTATEHAEIRRAVEGVIREAIEVAGVCARDEVLS
ncbi:MAG: phage regulatory CII family protein [Planctomycetota bacterium]